MKHLNIAMAFDSGIFPGARVTIQSIINAHCSTVLNFFILDGGVSVEQRDALDRIVSKKQGNSIKWIQFDKSKVSTFVSHQEFTHMTYARVLLPDLLEVAECIYIDADFLVTRDLSELTTLDSTRLIAAALDGEGSTAEEYPWHEGIVDSPFVNTGLMGMNLQGWRNEDISKKILDFLSIESARCRWADQNAINWILRDRAFIVDGGYNTMANQIDSGTKEFIPGLTNIHYASGLKPWKRPFPTLSHKIWRHFDSVQFDKAFGIAWTLPSVLKYVVSMFITRKLVYPFNRRARIALRQYIRALKSTPPS